MSRRNEDSKKKWITIIDIIAIVLFISIGTVLTILQDFGPEFFYIIPIIVFILVISIIIHITFLWGIKKGVIVDRRPKFETRGPTSYDPVQADSYHYRTNDEFLAERMGISDPDEAVAQAERNRLQAQRDRMTVTVTPQTMKSKKLKRPSVDPEGLNCSVCKLMIRANQAVLECPNCGALFHKKHIHEWLSDHDDCPICNQIITT